MEENVRINRGRIEREWAEYLFVTARMVVASKRRHHTCVSVDDVENILNPGKQGE